MSNSTTSVDFTGLFDGRPRNEHYDAPEQDKELVAQLKDWFRIAAEWRRPWDNTWELNRHYLKGDQLLAKHRVTGNVVRLSAEDSRKLRSTNNVLRPTARSLVGKLSRMIPTYKVEPSSADFDEQHAAKVADQILQYVRQQLQTDILYIKLNGFLPWAGNSFVELVWDHNAGRSIAFCEICNYFSIDENAIGQPCPQCATQRQNETQIQINDTDSNMMEALSVAMASTPGIEGASISEISKGVETPLAPTKQIGPLPPGTDIPLLVEAREGDVAFILRDPRDVYFSPGCTDVRKATRFAVRELMEVSEAIAQYPQFAPFLKADAVIDAERYEAYALRGMWITSSLQEVADHCFVYQFHEQPTLAYPKGRLITMINDIIVEEREHPIWSKIGRPSIYHIGFDSCEGELYRDPFITHAWHRQRELNRTETQIREGVDLTLRPKLMLPFGTRLATTEFTSDSGQVIEYNAAAGKAEWTQPPQLPNGLWTRKADLREDIRILAGVTESEQGIMGSDPNGRAAAIINAEADQQIGPIVKLNNEEWKQLHKGALCIYKEYVHRDRIATVAGPEGLQVFSFGALEKLRYGFDLRLQEEDALSRNPAIRLTQAMDLAQLGFFSNPMTGQLDKKAFARYAKLGTSDQGADAEAIERAAASQIPYLIQNGLPWDGPQPFDVPGIFAEVLGEWLRGPGRRSDPQLRQQIVQIWMYYQQILQAQQIAAQQAQQGGSASKAGSDQSARGGTPNNPGRVQSGGGGIAGDASKSISNADRAAEKSARTQSKHES